MPSNVEVKACVHDVACLTERARQLSQSEATLQQRDTFYSCSRGRLKLRDFLDGTGELIFYERPDTEGPKVSSYCVSTTRDPQGLREVLSSALCVRGEVVKQRRLFLVGQTRVHLDTVEGLGHFLELEVVMRPDQTVAEGHQVAHILMEQLGVSEADLVTGAYIDLLLNQDQTGPRN